MKSQLLPLFLAISLAVPPAYGRSTPPDPARRQALGETIKACGLPYNPGPAPLAYVLKETEAVHARHSRIRDGLTGERTPFPDPVREQAQPDPTRIARYESELSYQSRMKSAERLLKILWITHDPVADHELQSLADRLAGQVTGALCNSSGCNMKTRERLLQDMEKIGDGFVQWTYRPRGPPCPLGRQRTAPAAFSAMDLADDVHQIRCRSREKPDYRFLPLRAPERNGGSRTRSRVRRLALPVSATE